LLEFLNKSHPTLYGRKMIAQMVIEGCSQFLTQAQGMPKHIEDALIKLIRNFIWEENATPRIALEYLYYPIKKGGLNLLDIRARNEAIEIIWLKAYLNMSPERPTWAKITDIILDTTAPQGYNAQARMNTFLQTWNVPTWGTRVTGSWDKASVYALWTGVSSGTGLIRDVVVASAVSVCVSDLCFRLMFHEHLLMDSGVETP
jgi:hypothetical protein